MKLEEIATTPIFDVMKVKDDGTIGFDPVQIYSKDWVTVIAYDHDAKSIWTVKQLRYGIMKELVEFPCGMVEEDETPRSAAKREFEEEVGIEVDYDDFKFLGKVAANPAFMTNYMHYFYVDLHTCKMKMTKQNFDEHEKLVARGMRVVDFIDEVTDNPTSVFMELGLNYLKNEINLIEGELA